MQEKLPEAQAHVATGPEAGSPRLLLEVIDWSAAMAVLKAVGKQQWLEGAFDALCAALQ